MTRTNRILPFLLPVICSLFFLASCKPPIPVYFDKPIGIRLQGFDTILAGNYLPLDDVIENGKKEFSDQYEVHYDKIIKKDSGKSPEGNGKEINYEEVKGLIGAKNDSGRTAPDPSACDSIFKTFCSFNTLVTARLGNDIDKKGPVKPVIGIIKITYDRILFIGIDSAGTNRRDTILQLSPQVVLTKYSGKYFLNFSTPYGWEIMQLDAWEDKFLSSRLFYFTDYNTCSRTVPELTASTRNIYPGLKPVMNKEKKVIGYKAVLEPRLLLEKFKRSEEVVMLLKIK